MTTFVGSLLMFLALFNLRVVEQGNWGVAIDAFGVVFGVFIITKGEKWLHRLKALDRERLGE